MIAFVWYQNIRGASFSFVTMHACDRQTDRQTDERTDRQNYDSQNCASIAARAVKKIRDFRNNLLFRFMRILRNAYIRKQWISCRLKALAAHTDYVRLISHK